MKFMRILALCILAAGVVLSAGADWLAPHDFATQFREHANEPPSRQFPLGADSLGRDRFSRILYGGRVSLLCAPAAALFTIALAAGIGLVAGYFGGWVKAAADGAINLFMSLPWLFALLTLRALLPLNLHPWPSVAAMFLLLAGVGWASSARVVSAGVASLRTSPAILHARASGCPESRLLWIHILPNLMPVLTAQFWILVPVFLLTEANLGALGLGVVEPLPSWGNMLAELQNYQRVSESPWILAPALALVLMVAALHFAVSGGTTWE
jgi:ABC-type dipeptide/oligopeptide/nickel transport system permease subunit